MKSYLHSLLFSVFFLFCSAFIFTNISNAESGVTTSFGTPQATIQEPTVPLQVFVRDNCGHCQAEKEFLTNAIENNKIKASEIRYIDITENIKLFEEFSSQYEIFGTPITLAGNRIFQGYNDNTTGEKILDTYFNAEEKFTIEDAINTETENSSKIFVEGTAPVCIDESDTCSVSEKTIQVPFIGEVTITGATVQMRYLSSFLLGFLDGFNPCAMWVLTIFLIALMQVGDKMKMIFVAGTFMIAEVVMYGLILVVWWKFFNIFSIQYEFWVNLAVGVVAIAAGIFFLYEGFFSDGTCKVTSLEQQRSISQKIKKITQSPIGWVSFFGILMLAFSVNIIEFACSAGYPQIFSKILMPSFGGDFFHQMGILFTYLFAYMLDDLIVFGIALYSIEKIGITQKYATACNMIGGGLMLLLGSIMIFAPQLLKGIFG